MTAIFIPVIRRSIIVGYVRQSVNDGPWLALTLSGVPLAARVFETSEAAAHYVERRDIEAVERRERLSILTPTQPIAVVETHVDYPHEPGRLYDCPACEAACHCTPGTTECVFEGEHTIVSEPCS